MDQRLHGFDLYDPAHVQDLPEFCAHARSVSPVMRSSRYGGHWVVTGYDKVYEALLNPARFTSTKGATLSDTTGEGIALPPIDLDPPEHRSYRKILNPYFHPQALAPYEDQLRGIAGGLIASWRDRGTVELVSEFAAPFTARALGTVILGEQAPDRMDEIGHIVIATIEDGRPETFVAMRDMAADYLDRWRREGDPDADTVLKALVHGSVDGVPLTADQQIGSVMLLFLGGFDTTKTQISMAAVHMCEQPWLQDELADPQHTRARLDELLRLDAPVAAVVRAATGDTTLGGQQIKGGEKLLLVLTSANRDECKFADPDRLDFYRDNPHLAFGAGVHRCIGAHFARLQVRVALQSLLANVRELQLTSTRHHEYAPGPGHGPLFVDLRFTPVPRSATVNRAG